MNLNFWQKHLVLFAVFFSSCFLSVAMAEFFLYASARMIRSFQTKADSRGWPSERKSKEIINILALGDSYTFGGFGKNHDTYPNELNRLFLEKNKNKISVLNQGVCEYTSKQILEPLRETLLFSHADILLLLVGSADLFDPLPLTDELLSASQKLEKGIRGLRFFKVAKYILDKIEVYFYETHIKSNALSLASKDIEDLIYAFDEITLKLTKLSPTEINERFEFFNRRGNSTLNRKEKLELALAAYLLNKEANFFNTIETVIDQAYIKKNLNEFCFVQEKIDDFLRISKDYFERYTLKDSQQALLDRHLHAIRLGLHQCVRSSAWKILRAVAYNKINVKSAQGAFSTAVKRFPYLKDEKRTVSAQLALANQELWQAEVARNFEANMRKIIDTVQQNGVLLILQTYPISYSPINKITRKLSGEYGLLLVDHEKIFAPKIATEAGYREYILNDTHCTDKGHRLMAENVFKVLSADIFSDKKSVKKLIDHGSMIEPRL